MSDGGLQHYQQHQQWEEYQLNKIASAFVRAKREFSPALKTSTNPHFKSRYADLSACLEAVNDALLNNGIAVYQETSEDANGVTVETVFLHESGEMLRGGKLHVPASKQDPQQYGSALTYCRRYSLMAACGIAAEDDDGNAASKPAPAAQAAPAKPFDLAAACDWISKAHTIDEAKLRARKATDRAENDGQRKAIRQAFDDYEQAAMASA